MKVSQQAQAVDEADSVARREHGFSDDYIWVIAAIAAFFAMSNRLANFTACARMMSSMRLAAVKDLLASSVGRVPRNRPLAGRATTGLLEIGFHRATCLCPGSGQGPTTARAQQLGCWVGVTEPAGQPCRQRSSNSWKLYSIRTRPDLRSDGVNG